MSTNDIHLAWKSNDKDDIVNRIRHLKRSGLVKKSEEG